MAELSQNMQRRIRALVAGGMSRREVAKNLGLSPTAVNIELRINRNPPTLSEQAKAMIAEGYPESVVRANFGEVNL